MKSSRIVWFAVVALLASGCLAQPQVIQECVSGETAGFWMGLWHGAIAPFAFIASVFLDSVSVFEVNNNGNWYVFGFLLGIGAFSGGGAMGVRKGRKHRRARSE